MSAEPELLTGIVTADQYAKDTVAEIAQIRGVEVQSNKAAPRYGAKSPIPRRFKSRIDHLRIQMKSTPPRLSAEGYWVQGENRAVMFRPDGHGCGVLLTEDPDEILAVEGCSEYGTDVWDDDAMVREAENAYEDHLEAELAKRPSLVKRLAAKAGMKDFVDTPKQIEGRKHAEKGRKKDE